jgi:anti-anti-sigma factor
MSASKEKRQGGVSALSIDGEMSIYRAAELKPMLLAALEESPVLELDLSGVTELDTAGVQLLLLLKQTAQIAQRELQLTARSPAVLDVFEMLNLGMVFGDPVVIAPNRNEVSK